jgi:hypothetical protein
MNGPSDKQVIAPLLFSTTRDLVGGLDDLAWTKSMEFRVGSPPLQIGGVYDYFKFSTDESGKVATVSPIG